MNDAPGLAGSHICLSSKKGGKDLVDSPKYTPTVCPSSHGEIFTYLVFMMVKAPGQIVGKPFFSV